MPFSASFQRYLLVFVAIVFVRDKVAYQQCCFILLPNIFEESIKIAKKFYLKSFASEKEFYFY
jgi:hypothetical protein